MREVEVRESDTPFMLRNTFHSKFLFVETQHLCNNVSVTVTSGL